MPVRSILPLIISHCTFRSSSLFLIRTMATMTSTTTTTATIPATGSSAFTYSPIPTPPHADPTHFKDFGRQVKGYDPANVTPEQMQEIVHMLYKHGILLFKDLKLTPKQQYELTLVRFGLLPKLCGR